MNKSGNPTILWVRNDFRLQDNQALIYAASLENPIIPVYILEYENSPWAIGSASKWWLYHALKDFHQELAKFNLSLIIRKGNCAEVILGEIVKKVNAKCVVWNRAYDSIGVLRDARVFKKLSSLKIKIETFPGNVLFEPGTVFNKSKKPFKVFTAFYNHVKNLPVTSFKSFNKKHLKKYSLPLHSEELDSLGLLSNHYSQGLTSQWTPSIKAGEKLLRVFVNEKIEDYKLKRDIPSEQGTSRLSPYLHFGQISPQQIYHALSSLPPSIRDPYYRQILWREFAWASLFFFPKMGSISFKEEFETLKWHENEKLLEAWQKGMTGYPIVDAGMRELNETGWMHNRVRMIVGSFLVKDLLIHWLSGAKWFWDKLVDADLANNTFGWQWVAGCGFDASPFFRIFNPILQSQKFDPEGIYIKRFVPELSNVPLKFIHTPWIGKFSDTRIRIGIDYPEPIVSHHAAKISALRVYKQMKEFLNTPHTTRKTITKI